MTVYGRSDLAAVTISEAHGGCGETHSRPVEHGAPVKIWALDCPRCEDHLRHDPHWSATTAEVPETYDEQKKRERDEKSGKLDRENQLAAALIELGKLGQLPQALGQVLAPLLGSSPVLLAGQMECPQGHAQAAGMKFCGECGSPMSAPVTKAALNGAQPHAEPSAAASLQRHGSRPLRLQDLRLDELQAVARARGLESGGVRKDLVRRLKTAGVTNADLRQYLQPVAA